MEKQEIVEIFDFMKNVYQGRKIDDSDTAIETWEIMFSDYSRQEVINSIKNLVKTSKFVPSIHEILGGIEDLFTVEKMVKGKVIIIRVRYHDEAIPFKFLTKESAMEVVGYLKSNPSRADIRLLHEKNVHEMNLFTVGTRVDQSQREEFDKQQKNEYYARKLREQ